LKYNIVSSYFIVMIKFSKGLIMIIHLDLDSFFVSAHRTLDLSLHDKPVAVGGRSNLKIFEKQKVGTKLYNTNVGAFVNPIFYHDKQDDFQSFFVDHNSDGSQKIRGIVITASYEARACGVKTAMPIAQALQLCPSLTVISPNYLLYHKLSYALYGYLQKEFPQVEQFSIDEFFADVDGWVRDEDVFAFASHLQASIYRKFKLPISIGISSGKWIAKLATNFAKPNGVKLVKTDEIAGFIEDIPIRSFPGIGNGYANRLDKYFITTLGEAIRRKELFYQWKKPGMQLYHRISGDDHEGIYQKSDRKSIGISRTFDPQIDRKEILRRIMIMARHVVFLVYGYGVNPTSYYLKIQYSFMGSVKKTKSVDRIFSEILCKEIFEKLFDKIDIHRESIIKITLSVSNFSNQKQKTLSLLDLDEDFQRKKISDTLQILRQKYSLDIIKTASEL